MLAVAIQPTRGAPLTWDADGSGVNTGGSGTWDTTSATWYNGTTYQAWPTTGTDNDAVLPSAGGTVAIDAAGVTVNDLTLNAAYTIQGGAITFNGANSIIDVNIANSTIKSKLSGASNLEVQGATFLYLDGDNDFTGSLAITNSGLVVFSHPNGLGSSSQGTVVNPGTTLQVQNMAAGRVIAEPVSLAGTGNGARGALRFLGGSGLTWQGNITLAGDALIISEQINISEQSNIIGGVIDGAAGNDLTLLCSQTAPLLLTAANTYQGNTFIAQGPVQLSGGANRLPVGTTLTLGSSSNSASLRLAGNDQELAGLLTAGSGTDNRVVNGSATAASLTLAIASGTNTFAGILGGTATNDNHLNLVKDGAGTLVLSGANTYTGSTQVKAGTLALGGGSNRLPTGTVVTLGDGTGSGVLKLGGNDQQLAGLVTSGTGTANRVVNDSATAATLRLAIASGTNTFTGVLGGSTANENRFGLTKTGSGTLVLGGDGNTFTGKTVVTGGLLRIGKEEHLGANPGSLVADQLTLNGASLDLSATTIIDDSGRGITIGPGGASFYATGGELKLYSPLAGSGRLSIRGLTRLYSGGNDAFDGPIDVYVSYLILNTADPGVLGTTAGATTVVDGGCLVFEASGLTTAEPLVISGHGGGQPAYSGGGAHPVYGRTGALRANNPATLTGPVTLAADSTIITTGGNLAISGDIGETGGSWSLYKRGNNNVPTSPGILTLSGQCSYTGNTYIQNGTLAIAGGDNRLPVGTTVVLGNDTIKPDSTRSGTLQLGGNRQTLAGLVTSGTGTDNRVTGGSATEGELTLNIVSGENVFNGFLGGATANDNRFRLTKDGDGTLTLGSTNTYTGATTVADGTLTLAAAGAIDASSRIDLAAGTTLDVTAKSGGFMIPTGQTLAGDGLVKLAAGTTLDVAGTLAPGHSPGTLSIAGNLALAGTTTIEINGWTDGLFDRVQGTAAPEENVTFGGILNFVFGPGVGEGSATIFDFDSFAGNFSLITATGLGVGCRYQFDSQSGVLSVFVPEPSPLILLILGGLLVGWRRRRILDF